MGFLSNIGKGIGSILNPGKGYADAGKEMERAWQDAQKYQVPYQRAGLDQLGRLTGAEDALLDPSKLLADWMGKYETSPYAQKSLENAREAGMSGASSMGLLGSSSALQNIQNSASDIMNADRTQFLNDLMQKYMTGIGIGQNIYGIGAQTGANLGQQRIGVGESLGQAAYGSQNAMGDFLRNLLATGGKMYMYKNLFD